MNRELSIEQRATEWANLFGIAHSSSKLAEVFRTRDKYLLAEEFYISFKEIGCEARRQ